jgi:hypothetical protein
MDPWNDGTRGRLHAQATAGSVRLRAAQRQVLDRNSLRHGTPGAGLKIAGLKIAGLKINKAVNIVSPNCQAQRSFGSTEAPSP